VANAIIAIYDNNLKCFGAGHKDDGIAIVKNFCR